MIFNEVPIQQYYALPYDRWEGYEAERKELLQFLRNKVNNAVFLTTDVHANLVNDARFNTLGGSGVKDSGILDVTTGPVATENYAGEISGAVGNPAAGALIHEPVPASRSRPAGVGMQCAATDQFSYAEVEVTKQQLTSTCSTTRTSRCSTRAIRRTPAPALLAGRDPGRVGAGLRPGRTIARCRRIATRACAAADSRRSGLCPKPRPPRPPTPPAPSSGSRPRTCGPPAWRFAPARRALRHPI